MLNSQDEWIWAKADRADWDVVRAELALTAKPLGICLQNYNAATRPPFVKGSIIVAYGEMRGGAMGWTSVTGSEANNTRWITRPGSYLVSHNLVNKRSSLRYRAGS